ncbi:hypothetical protein E2C01_005996 [Portunus trituberculatus]|uniref:Uncharacterized protein n=1 Tax=Portunus trituberculatus TaxID=210409 RepID=A0A5B7CVQ1_PORTR|nr:hypothetical protein [Portunus trituberculatus]
MYNETIWIHPIEGGTLILLIDTVSGDMGLQTGHREEPFPANGAVIAFTAFWGVNMVIRKISYPTLSSVRGRMSVLVRNTKEPSICITTQFCSSITSESSDLLMVFSQSLTRYTLLTEKRT